MMFVRTHVFRESRCYENNVCTCGLTHQFLLDDCVIFGENIMFVLGFFDLFLCFTFSPSFVTMSSSKPIGVGRMNRWTRNAAQRLKNYYYEALAFSRYNIDLVFDEANMKPERLTEAPENAGIDLSTTRVSKWYQEPTRDDADSQFSSSSRESDVFTGTSGTSYQEREPIENDEERLAMKRGDMPVREFETIKHYTNFIRTRTRCTVLPLMTLSHKHGLIIADLFPQSVR